MIRNSLYPVQLEMTQDQSGTIVYANLPKTKIKINNEYEDLLKIKTIYSIFLGKTNREITVQPNSTIKVQTRKESSNATKSSVKRQGSLTSLSTRLYRQEYLYQS